MRNWERALLYAGLAVGGLLIVHLSRQFEALSTNYTQLRERLQWPHAGCRASLAAWREITTVARLEAPDVDVLGIGVDADGPIQEYRQEHQLEFPVLTFPEPKLQRLYRARYVPLIALLDPEGRVQYSRVGALEDPAAVDSVLAALRTRPEPDPVTDTVADGG
jgi:hypothetical protein